MFNHSLVISAMVALFMFAPSLLLADAGESNNQAMATQVTRSSLANGRLFFSVEERKLNATDSTESNLLAPVQDSEELALSGQAKQAAVIDSQARLSGSGDTATTLRFQAVLKSVHAVTLVLNGLPCDVLVSGLAQAAPSPMAVQCRSAALSELQMRWLPARGVLEVQQAGGRASILMPGESL